MATSNSHDYDQELFKDIVPKYRYDGKEPLSIWKKRAYARLWDRLGLDAMRPASDDKLRIISKEQTQYGLEIDFTFESEPGYEVPAFVIMPNGVENPQAALCIQGHSRGFHLSRGRVKYEKDAAFLSDPDRMYAVRAANEGYAAFAIEQRYMGVCGHDEAADKPGCVRGRSMPALLMGRCAIGERVWDIMRLIDVIEKHFTEVRTDGILCFGNSGGGTATYYAACMDERIKYAMPSCSICTFYDSIVVHRHCQCNYIPGIAFDFDQGDMAGLIAPRGLIILNGSEDPDFPRDGVDRMFEDVQRMYDYAGVPDRCIHRMGIGGHRFYATEGFEALKKLKEIME